MPCRPRQTRARGDAAGFRRFASRPTVAITPRSRSTWKSPSMSRSSASSNTIDRVAPTAPTAVTSVAPVARPPWSRRTVDASTRCSPSDCPKVAPNWFSDHRSQADRSLQLLGRPPAGSVGAEKWRYFTDTQPVIAQTQRRNGQGEAVRALLPGGPQCRRRRREPDGRYARSTGPAPLPVAIPAGFHQVAVASSATATNAPAMPCARVPTISYICAPAAAGRNGQKGGREHSSTGQGSPHGEVYRPFLPNYSIPQSPNSPIPCVP